MTTKQKGAIAELAIASDLAKRGYVVAIPFGNYGHWDLLVQRTETGLFERVQVKYSTSDGTIITVRGRCHSVLAGRVGSTTVYTPEHIDWLAIFEPTTEDCYYVPASELNNSGCLYLRLAEPKGSKINTIRWAKDYRII